MYEPGPLVYMIASILYLSISLVRKGRSISEVFLSEDSVSINSPSLYTPKRSGEDMEIMRSLCE